MPSSAVGISLLVVSQCNLCSLTEKHGRSHFIHSFTLSVASHKKKNAASFMWLTLASFAPTLQIKSLAVSQFKACILRRSHLKANFVPIQRLLQMQPSFPVFGGCTATILGGLTYPKILCAPKKEERKRENAGVWHKGKTSGDAIREWSKD